MHVMSGDQSNYVHAFINSYTISVCIYIGMSQQHIYNRSHRCHSSDIYFQRYPIQNGISYVANCLAHMGETSATMVKMNN